YPLATTAHLTTPAPGGATPELPSAASMADRSRRNLAVRALAGVVAGTLWLGPLQVSLQQATQAAGGLAAGAVDVDAPAEQARAVREGLLRWALNHLPVTVSFGLHEANATPIVDPAAPVRFQPAMGATTGPGAPAGGTPYVNITTPNS